MVSRTTSLLVFASLLVCFSLSRASSPSYYTVHDGSTPDIQDASMDPFETLSEIAADVSKRAPSLDLMNWDHHNQTLKDPSVPYNRLQQFGTWVHDSRDSNCYNTRAKVLIRDSSVPVSFSGRGACTVRSGEWHDPYSDRTFTDAADLQIDHVVPLKNSYVSGAWTWDNKKRCLYGNFLENNFHLLAVNGRDNMKKGDRTPEEFVPENPAFVCQYLTIWLKIKLIWNLAMTPSEADAISKLTQQNHCDSSTLSMTSLDLRQQRQAITDNMDLCAK